MITPKSSFSFLDIVAVILNLIQYAAVIVLPVVVILLIFLFTKINFLAWLFSILIQIVFFTEWYLLPNDLTMLWYIASIVVYAIFTAMFCFELMPQKSDLQLYLDGQL